LSRLNQYSVEARQILVYAREEAVQLRHKSVGPEHILFGILRGNDPIVGSIFSTLHVDVQRLRQALEFVVGRGNKALLNGPTLSSTARTALTHAEREAAPGAFPVQVSGFCTP